MHLQDDQLTFGRIADEWARELANEPGGLDRDEIFHELIRAVWRRDFEDEDGENSCLTIHRPPKGGAVRIDGRFVDGQHQRTAETRPVQANRRWLLCALALACPPGLTLPAGDRLRGWRSPKSDHPEPAPWPEVKQEVPWATLDALQPDEYDHWFRRSYLEKLSIPKGRFGEWCLSQGNRRPVFWFGKDPGLDQSARSKGGARKKYDNGLQEFVGYVRDKLRAQGRDLTLGTLKDWLWENATSNEPCEPEISNCDDVYAEGGKISWTDSSGRKNERALRSLESYIRRAKAA